MKVDETLEVKDEDFKLFTETDSKEYKNVASVHYKTVLPYFL